MANAATALSVVKPEQLAIENVAALRQANFLVLTPTDQIMQLNPVFSARLQHVPVDTSIPQGKQGTVDLWKPPGGGAAYAPTKVLLNKIASAANVVWDIQETKRIDNRSDRYYCAYQAVGYIRLPSGEMKTFRDEATEDARIVEEEILLKWKEKIGQERVLEWENGRPKKKGVIDEDFAKSAARKEFLAYHKFFEERAMARAMNRAIRQVLALNGTYTLEELKKGFIVPSVNFSPDWNDPRNKQALDALLFGGIRNMVGIQEKPDMNALAPVDAPAIPEAPMVDAITGEVEPTEAEPAELAAIETGEPPINQAEEITEAEIVEPEKTEPEKKAPIRPQPKVKFSAEGWPISMIDPTPGAWGGRFPKKEEFDAMTDEGKATWQPRIERAIEIADSLKK